MTRNRSAAVLAVLTLCGLAVGAASAAAAATPKYRLTLFVFRGETSRLQDGGYPDDCASWTQATSTVAFEMRPGRAVNLALIRNPITDTIWGQVGSDLKPQTEIYRYWRYRSHVSPSTEACSPCGPLSEYGPCTGETFDDRGTDDCGSTDGPVRRGALTLIVSGRGLAVSAYPMAAFATCAEPGQDGLPLGSNDPKIDSFLLPNATRELLGMPVGSTRLIRRKLSGGPCGRLRGRGLRVCIETTVHIRATRFA